MSDPDEHESFVITAICEVCERKVFDYTVCTCETIYCEACAPDNMALCPNCGNSVCNRCFRGHLKLDMPFCSADCEKEYNESEE